MVAKYAEWNTALWNYFIPNRVEDPLFIDEDLLRVIGENARIRKEGETWTDDFLTKILINSNDFCRFTNSWREQTGHWCRVDDQPVNSWDQAVVFFKKNRLREVPAYFAVLCAIMSLAATEGANHNKINLKASHYLGDRYRGNVGEFVDDLMQKLREDVPAFNPNRMSGGNKRQRHMSRIKYHLVLNTKERKDLIDFLEINDLRWDNKSYTDYVNDILIPALTRGRKTNIINKVLQQETISYFKNLLRSGLDFGKNNSQFGNTIQIKEIKWRYEIEIDDNATALFHIVIDDYIPFGIQLENGTFTKCNELSDYYIASNLRVFQAFNETEIKHETFSYLMFNIAQIQSRWSRYLYFEQVGEERYQQVQEPIEGRSYIMLIKNGTKHNERFTSNWSVSDINIEGYQVFEISSFTKRERTTRRNDNTLKNIFDLKGVGSWFSINLQEGQQLYWFPYTLDGRTDRENDIEKHKINGILKNGKTYFQLPKNNSKFLGGDLKVNYEDDCIMPPEQILEDFHWDGMTMKYGYNEWGEVVETGIINPIEEMPQTQNVDCAHINCCRKPLSSSNNMLLQILYDVADENGCVSQKGMVAALDFVLEFHGLPKDRSKHKNIIDALKKLGFICSLKDYNHNGEYINQLTPAFLEITNYTIRMENGVYMIKGVYNSNSLDSLLSVIPQLRIRNQYIQEDDKLLRYKRPYPPESEKRYPEYVCLPDVILFKNDSVQEWQIKDHPVAYDMMHAMANMDAFEEHFKINEGGDIYNTNEDLSTPCMVKDGENQEFLCTTNYLDRYIRHERYFDDNHYSHPIPKDLSRAYCCNRKKLPICLMGHDARTNSMDFSKIMFVQGYMGIPDLLEMALCDLNLGLATFENIFVVDIINSGIPLSTSTLYHIGICFSTNANEDTILFKNCVSKLSGRNIADHQQSEVFVYKSNRHINYKLKYTKINHVGSLLLYNNDNKLVAFTFREEAYKLCEKGVYYEIVGESINQKLSDVINNHNITTSQAYNGTIPYIDNEKVKDIRIIQKR